MTNMNLKKHAYIIIGLISITTIALVLSELFSTKQTENFLRIEPVNNPTDTALFRVDKNLHRIWYKKGDNETQLEGLPSIKGYYFYLKGKKQIRVNLPMAGNVGLYSYLYMKSKAKGGKIDFKMELFSEGEKKRSTGFPLRFSQCLSSDLRRS